jgi:hypothetical protein
MAKTYFCHSSDPMKFLLVTPSLPAQDYLLVLANEISNALFLCVGWNLQIMTGFLVNAVIKLQHTAFLYLHKSTVNFMLVLLRALVP